MFKKYQLFFVSLLLICNSFVGNAQSSSAMAEVPAAPHEEKKGLDVKELIFGHISDAYDWHFWGEGENTVSVPLPVIIYHPEKGLSVFSASKFHHGHETYNGYQLVNDDYIAERTHSGAATEELLMLAGRKGKIISTDGVAIKDFSITKNVVSMFLSVILLIVIMTTVAKKYKKNGVMKAPSGFQNALEPVITFIRDEVAKPNLGNHYMRFMPLILTVFFFIWINNMMGLLPSGANLTGNIATTAALSLVSFVFIVFCAKKGFWAHLFNPPGVPFLAKILLVIIEIISLFIKPIALTIRLFANMLAGHIIILSVVAMIFIFGGMSKVAGWSFAPVSVAFSVFMFCLELLVAAIQAFIFANLTAVFIGQGIEEHEHEAHELGYDHAHDENELAM